jgi:hypothetical protein
MNGLKVCLKIEARLNTKKQKTLIAEKIVAHKKYLDSFLLDKLNERSESVLKPLTSICKETNVYRYLFYRKLIQFPIFFKLILKLMRIVDALKIKLIYA